MIVEAEIVAFHVETVDHARRQVGREQLPRARIEGDVAQARAAVGQAVLHHIGEQRHGARGAVDFPDAAGPATRRAPLSGHPLRRGLADLDPLRLAAGVGNDDLQPIDRRRRQIDRGRAAPRAVRPFAVVEGDAEDLAGNPRRNLERRRRIENLRLRRLAGIGHVEDAHDGAGGIDECRVDRIAADRRGRRSRHAGKAGDDEGAVRQQWLLPVGFKLPSKGCEKGDRRRGEKRQPSAFPTRIRHGRLRRCAGPMHDVIDPTRRATRGAPSRGRC